MWPTPTSSSWRRSTPFAPAARSIHCPRRRVTSLRSATSTMAWADHRRLHAEMNVVGLLVITQVVSSSSAHAGTHRHTRRASMSVAKSVTSLLYGAAVREGLIQSLDDGSRPQPRAKGSAYDGDGGICCRCPPVSRGPAPRGPAVRCVAAIAIERPAASRAARLHGDASARRGTRTAVQLQHVGDHLAGAILRGMTGRTLLSYLEKIWRRFGIQADGYWLTMHGGDL